MPLTNFQINNAFRKFIRLRNSYHRYASFDYCYNYFYSFKPKSDLASSENIEKSCMHLGFYLASWGMFRNSELMQKSLRYYIPIIEWFALECPLELWEIDVDNYDNNKIEKLLLSYKKMDELFKDINKYRLTLITKTMLGVFGNTPAFDQFFIKTFKKHFISKPAFTSFNFKSLLSIKNFYSDNIDLIEELRKKSKTFDFITGSETNILYTRAKIIDMIGFGHSFKPKGE